LGDFLQLGQLLRTIVGQNWVILAVIGRFMLAKNYPPTKVTGVAQRINILAAFWAF